MDPDGGELQQLHGNMALHIYRGMAREHHTGTGNGVFLARLVTDINHGNFVAHGNISNPEMNKPGTGPGAR